MDNRDIADPESDGTLQERVEYPNVLLTGTFNFLRGIAYPKSSIKLLGLSGKVVGMEALGGAFFSPGCCSLT
ncbi:hypothetical protein [Methanolobus chelungpuianus]|uniref:Uncharacterized protein n=1 Tax=Methanolobus chelungpuianus TaxID=502115 RepID=A0AAE3HBL7_9EURY|nr:hypothetical protein [Methanolobus chelungpuianus]MCQ6963600.1 hypothetical protein [Methanolobus chelungpuianus]